MKTQGEIESAISGGMGRWPKDILAHPVDDLYVIRRKGVFRGGVDGLVRLSHPIGAAN
jgi:hypothetical protein